MQAKIISLALLALLLFGCNTAPVRPQFPTATPIAVPTLSPEALATLLPALAPTLVPTPGPADLPTETPDLVTVVPTPAVTEPAPTGVAERSATIATVATLCDNPFYPAGPNARWQYRVSTTAGSSDYSKTIMQLAADSFTEHRAFDGVSSDNTWMCTADGLVSNQFGNLHVHGQTQYVFDTTSSSGITIPPANQWVPSATWSNAYGIAGQVNAGGFNISGTGAVTLQNTIAGREQVTVPAGAYDALRVDSRISMRLTPSGLGLPVTLTLDQSSWYAQDTGLVKSTLTLNGQSAMTELVSYTP